MPKTKIKKEKGVSFLLGHENVAARNLFSPTCFRHQENEEQKTKKKPTKQEKEVKGRLF